MPDPTPVSRRKLGAAGAVVAVGLGVIVVTGITARQKGDAHLREWTDAQAVPTVAVAPPDAKLLVTTINLPGRLEAYYRAPIFARVSGYVKSWTVDIGAKVRSGDVLAEIEAPDLDQQLLQARADLLNAQAAARLSEATLKRRQTLLTQNFASQQDIDERTADLNSKTALVKASQANVDRLEVLASYKKLTAPFDGIVTARDTDVGTLINSGGGGAPMFVISDIRKLRVYVNVPQTFVPLVKVGTRATISLPEYPSRSFQAVVESASQSIDSATATSRMQLGVPNEAGELLPGSTGTVRLELTNDAQPLHIPASALIFDQSGLRVATVGPGDKVVFRKVTIARDLGREIEIASGLNADDRVILSPPDGLNEGDPVRVAGATGRKPAPTAEALPPGKS
jgi:RND family efflux transporter MFP subunit